MTTSISISKKKKKIMTIMDRIYY